MHHLSLSNCFMLDHSCPKIQQIIHVLVKRLKDREVPTSAEFRQRKKIGGTEYTRTQNNQRSNDLYNQQTVEYQFVKQSPDYNKLQQMTKDVHVSTLNLVNGIAWTKTDGQLWTFWNLQSVKLLEVICQQESQFCGTFYPLSNLSNKTRQNKRWLSHFAEPCSSRLLACSSVDLAPQPSPTSQLHKHISQQRSRSMKASVGARAVQNWVASRWCPNSCNGSWLWLKLLKMVYDEVFYPPSS